MPAGMLRLTPTWPQTGHVGVSVIWRTAAAFLAGTLSMALPGRASLSWRRQDARATQFQDLFVPHLDAAYNLARFLSRDADAAQDIVQEAYLRAFNALDGYRGGEPRAWILAIVRNCYRAWANHHRHERAHLAAATGPDDPGWGLGVVDLEEVAAPDHETPETALERQREADAVRRLIEALPEPFREVLVLRELEECGYRQIADITGTPVGTVMSRLARARRLFGAAWKRHIGEAETEE